MSHALLAPSAAHRWIHCPGSVRLSADIPNTSSSFAEEGTRAHALAAAMLVEDTPLPTDIEPEMLEFVDVYVKAICRAAEGKKLFVEMPISISKFTGEPNAKGTSDAVIVGFEGTIEVHDLKYGEGVIVYAEHNPQLMLYALGVLDMVGDIVDVENIKLVIHQPRRDHMSEWTVSRADLLEFAEVVRGMATLALSTAAGENLNPSAEACQWCPAKATCPALTQLVYDNVMRDFEMEAAVMEHPPQIEYPTPNVIALIEGWVSAQKQAIFEKLQRWEPVPGWKLVLGRKGNRQWKDEAKVAEVLEALRIKKSDSHELTLKSPTQLEKLGLSVRKWAKVCEYITRSDGKPTMVDEKDDRPAIQQVSPDAFEMFT